MAALGTAVGCDEGGYALLGDMIGAAAGAAALLEPGLGAAEEAGGPEGAVFYHGTDVQSALSFLNGAGLDAGEAAARARGGDLGFYLAQEHEAAGVFASRSGHALNSKGTILQYEISQEAVAQLQNAGADIRPIPYGGGLGNPDGTEFFIPPSAFDLFNALRDAGQIRITPFRE